MTSATLANMAERMRQRLAVTKTKPMKAPMDSGVLYLRRITAPTAVRPTYNCGAKQAGEPGLGVGRG